LTMNAPRLLERYSREIIVKEVGQRGLKKFRSSRVAVVGCGALGSAEAELLVRAGVGYLKVIDDDCVDISNLPRTHLFTQEDSERALPKAVACSLRLKEIEPESRVEPVIKHVSPENVERILSDVDLILDGTDNMETRMLINELSVKTGIPWIYAGVEEWRGMIMLIIPRRTPCLRCMISKYPRLPSSRCETVGVMGTAATLVATIAVNEGIKHILGLNAGGELIYVDTLRMELRKFKVMKDKDCPVCSAGNFEYLGKKMEVRVRRLCGSPDVMVYLPEESKNIDVFNKAREALKAKQLSPYSLRLKIKDKDVILFHDGRAIVKDVRDEHEALSLYEELLKRLKRN